MSRLPRPLALLVALAAASLLAACGSGSGGSADRVLSDTFSGSRSVHSGKVDLSLTVNLRGLPQLRGPLDIRVTGPFDRPGPKAVPRFDFSLLAGLSCQRLTAGAVSVGDRGWLRFEGRTYTVPDAVFRQFQQGFQKTSGSGSKSKTTFSSLGIDPRRWLKDPRDEGTEDVGGVQTDHVSSQIDVERFLGDLNNILAKASSLGAPASSTRLSASQRRDIAGAVRNARFDVWSGSKDHIMRRLSLRLGFQVPAAKRKSTGGLQSGDVSFRLQLTDVNRPQTIRAPTGARPLSELTKALRGLGSLGVGAGSASGSGSSSGSGGSGSSGGSGGSGSSGSGAGTDEFQRYSQCVTQAGGDIAKVQRCADLLNG
jgi:hypothetical protein